MSKMSRQILTLTVILCCVISQGIADPLFIGYYSNWSQFRPPPADFEPDDLKPIISKLTDIHYAYLFFNFNAEKRFPTNNWKIRFTEFNDRERLTEVVRIAGSRNVFASVGGYDFNDPTHPYGVFTFPFFSQMVADPAKYNLFIQSAIDLCNEFDLAGISIEWEFPGVPSRGGSTSDYQNLANFLSVFRTQLTANGFKLRMAIPGRTPEGFVSGFAAINNPLTNTTRFFIITSDNSQSYFDYFSGLSQYVDLFFVMCYDYFGPEWQPDNGSSALPLTGENAPLNPNPKIDQVNRNPTCVKETVTALLNNSQYPDQPTPKDKIVVGIPAYGRTFRGVKFPGNLPHQPFGPGAEFTAADTLGHYTFLPGFLAYYEIKYNLCNYYTNTRTNPITQTAYAWNPKTKNPLWVSFDNGSTARRKGRFIVKSDLRGGGIWTLAEDNFFDRNPYTLSRNLAEGLGL